MIVRHTVPTLLHQSQFSFSFFRCCCLIFSTQLCYAMLCYAMLCYAMLCYAMLCYAMLCYAMLCYAQLYSGLLFFVVSTSIMSRSLHYSLSSLLSLLPPLTSVLLFFLFVLYGMVWYGTVRCDTVYQDIAAAEKKKKLLAKKQRNIEQAQEERKRKAAD